MARNLTALMLAELDKRKLKPCVLVQLYFTSGWVYMWTGLGSIVWNNQTWLGVGTLGSISPIKETVEVSAEPLKLSLSGIPLELLVQCMNEIRHGAPVHVWQAFLDQNNQIIADPYEVWEGEMGGCTIDEGAESATISLTVESKLIALKQAAGKRYEQQNHQADFPGDIGFEFIPKLQELNLVWGGPGGAHIASPVYQPTYDPTYDPTYWDY